MNNYNKESQNTTTKKKKNHRSERKAAREEGKNFGLQDSPKKQLPKWQQ